MNVALDSSYIQSPLAVNIHKIHLYNTQFARSSALSIVFTPHFHCFFRSFFRFGIVCVFIFFPLLSPFIMLFTLFMLIFIPLFLVFFLAPFWLYTVACYCRVCVQHTGNKFIIELMFGPKWVRVSVCVCVWSEAKEIQQTTNREV